MRRLQLADTARSVSSVFHRPRRRPAATAERTLIRADGRRVGRDPARAGRALLELRGRERRAHRPQPRLDRATQRDRLPARDRQALPLGTRLKKDAVSARLNSEAASATPSSATRSCRAWTTSSCTARTAACCRPAAATMGNLTSGTDLVRKVEAFRARDRHAADHQQRRHEVRQERGQCHLAGCRDVQPVDDVPVLLNTDDRDVIERLKVFTFLTRAEIEEYAALVDAEPFRRAAQKRLAREVLTTVHGGDHGKRDRRDRGAVRPGRSDRARRRCAPQRPERAAARDGRRRYTGRRGAHRHRPLVEPERRAPRDRAGRRLARRREGRGDDTVVQGTPPAGCRCCAAARRRSRDSSSADMPFTPATPSSRFRSCAHGCSGGDRDPAMTPDLPLFVRGMWPDYGLTHDFAWLPLTVVVAFVLLLVCGACCVRRRASCCRDRWRAVAGAVGCRARAALRESVGGGVVGIVWLVLSLRWESPRTSRGTCSRTKGGRANSSSPPRRPLGSLLGDEVAAVRAGSSGWPCWGSSRSCGCRGTRPSPCGGCFRMPPWAWWLSLPSRWSWHPSSHSSERGFDEEYTTTHLIYAC